MLSRQEWERLSEREQQQLLTDTLDAFAKQIQALKNDLNLLVQAKNREEYLLFIDMVGLNLSLTREQVLMKIIMHEPEDSEILQRGVECGVFRRKKREGQND